MFVPEGLSYQQLEVTANAVCQLWRLQMTGDGLDLRSANRIIVNAILSGIKLADDLDAVRPATGKVVPFKVAGGAA